MIAANHKTEELLTVFEFGDALFLTGDLDPVYIALVRAREKGWTQEYLWRWMVAYWCYYNAGVACFLARKTDTCFWLDMLTAARNQSPSPLGKRWPRGRERRHFRGQIALRAISSLSERYPDPHQFIHYLFKPTRQPVREVVERVRQEYAFGPWIAFKVADMGETVLGYEVEFDLATTMYKEPREGCELVRQAFGVTSMEHTIDILQEYWWKQLAPPRYQRKVGLQEIETILCKYKAHVHGRYPVGLDTLEIREGIEPWAAVCPEAAQFMEGLPQC